MTHAVKVLSTEIMICSNAVERTLGMIVLFRGNDEHPSIAFNRVNRMKGFARKAWSCAQALEVLSRDDMERV